MTKVKREKSFAAHWISSKCRENFCSYCFICLESAKENHCSIEHSSTKLCGLLKSTKTAKLFSCLTLSFTVHAL